MVAKVQTHIKVTPPFHSTFHLHLAPEIRKLFLKAFDYGHTNPRLRPSAEEWGKTLFRIVNETEVSMPQQVVKPKPVTRLSRPQERVVPKVSPRRNSAIKHVNPNYNKRKHKIKPKAKSTTNYGGVVVFLILLLFVIGGGYYFFKNELKKEPRTKVTITPKGGNEVKVKTEQEKVVERFINYIGSQQLDEAFALARNDNWKSKKGFDRGYGGVVSTRIEKVKLRNSPANYPIVWIRYYAKDPMNDRKKHGKVGVMVRTRFSPQRFQWQV